MNTDAQFFKEFVNSFGNHCRGTLQDQAEHNRKNFIFDFVVSIVTVVIAAGFFFGGYLFEEASSVMTFLSLPFFALTVFFFDHGAKALARAQTAEKEYVKTTLAFYGKYHGSKPLPDELLDKLQGTARHLVAPNVAHAYQHMERYMTTPAKTHKQYCIIRDNFDNLAR